VPGTTQAALNTSYTAYGTTSGPFGPSRGVEWIDTPPPLESITTIVEGGNGGSGSGTFPLVMEQTSPLKSSSSPEESHVNSPAPVSLPPEGLDTLDSSSRSSGQGQKPKIEIGKFYSSFERREARDT